MSENPTSRSTGWKWVVCGLLLSATMINYMDRQTLATMSKRVTDEFDLSAVQYGDLELAFGWAFAAGSLFFGFLVDVVPVRLLYPLILLAWSAAGFATSFVEGYDDLRTCRTLLGFFEAGHWPCALQTIQRLLLRRDRHLGNSILQSGAAVGAITTPLLIRLLVGDDFTPGLWRKPFWVVGLIGPLWIVAWFLLVGRNDLTLREEAVDTDPEQGESKRPFPWRRFFALAVMVTALNGMWQLLRAWLPKFLQEGRQYTEASALYFNSAFYVAADLGCLAAGVLSFRLARRGVEVHSARLWVYAICCGLTALTVVAAFTPKGWPLLAVLLLVAAGALGLFPCYYSFGQELSVRHVGKVTGILAAIGWFLSSPLQPLFGQLKDRTGSYDEGLILVGLMPLAGLVAMLTLWTSDLARPSGAHPFLPCHPLMLLLTPICRKNQ